jgi:hypothetical protein
LLDISLILPKWKESRQGRDRHEKSGKKKGEHSAFGVVWAVAMFGFPAKSPYAEFPTVVSTNPPANSTSISLIQVGHSPYISLCVNDVLNVKEGISFVFEKVLSSNFLFK